MIASDLYDLFKPFFLTVKVGSFFMALPYESKDNEINTMKVHSNALIFKIWQILAITDLLGILFAISTLLYALLFTEPRHEAKELIFFLLLLGLFLSSFSINIMILKFRYYFAFVTKSLLQIIKMNEKISKQCGISDSTNHQANNKKILIILYLFIYTLGLLIGPFFLTYFFAVHNDSFFFFRINTGIILVTIIEAIGATAQIFYTSLQAIFIMSVEVLYLTTISQCTNCLKTSWKANLNSQIKWKVHLSYRTNQIIHNITTPVVHIYVPLQIMLIELLLISSIYLSISVELALLVQTFNIILLVILFSFLKLTLQSASKYTQASSDFSKILHFKRRLNRNKMDERRFKSYSKLNFSLGFNGSIPIKKQSFVNVLQDVVLTSVLNLILIIK